MPLRGVEPIVGAVEELVEHVVARRDQARRDDGDAERDDARPGGDVRLVEHGEHDAEQHEGVLEPVIDSGNLDVRPKIDAP